MLSRLLHHTYIVLWGAADAAGLALYALPLVRPHRLHHVVSELQTCGVTCGGTTRRSKRNEEEAKEWIARGWTKQMQSCFSYVTGRRRLFTRRSWTGADSRRRRTDTSKHIYIIHQKLIYIICSCSWCKCSNNVSPVLIKMNGFSTVFPPCSDFEIRLLVYAVERKSLCLSDSIKCFALEINKMQIKTKWFLPSG